MSDDQLTPAMLCNETAAGTNFSSGSAKWAALCEEKWRLRRGGRHWSGWGRDDMWQKGVKRAVGRKKWGLKSHGKSAENYNWLFSLWLRYSMSFLTKLPQEVLEQVSHIFKFNQLSQNVSRYKAQNWDLLSDLYLVSIFDSAFANLVGWIEQERPTHSRYSAAKRL